MTITNSGNFRECANRLLFRVDDDTPWMPSTSFTGEVDNEDEVRKSVARNCRMSFRVSFVMVDKHDSMDNCGCE